MKAYLGIDIGTFESKGVLVDGAGRILASAAQPHKMLVPQPGWAEHRPQEDWWADFTTISRTLLAESGVSPAEVKAVGTSAIGPCMLPVDGEQPHMIQRRMDPEDRHTLAYRAGDRCTAAPLRPCGAARRP